MNAFLEPLLRPPRTTGDITRRMRRWAILLGMFGSLFVLSILGTHDTDARRQLLLESFAPLGIIYLSRAAGLWKRKMFAWRLGFVAIPYTAAVISASQMFNLEEHLNKPEYKIFAVALPLANAFITIVWSYRWYRQKEMFSIPPNLPS